MKRLSIVLLVILVAFLSSCAAKDSDYNPQIIFDQYETLTYNFKSLTFTDTQPHDILYGTGNPYDDYTILNEKYEDSSENIEKQAAYMSTFLLLDTLATSTNFEYGEISEYSTQDIKDYSDQAVVEVTVTELITFNAVKTEINYLSSTENTTTYTIGKVDYIELRLDRTLSDTDIRALERLQTTMNQLYDYGFELDLSTITIDELWSELDIKLGYSPPPEEQTELETALTIIQQLHTND